MKATILAHISALIVTVCVSAVSVAAPGEKFDTSAFMLKDLSKLGIPSHSKPEFVIEKLEGLLKERRDLRMASGGLDTGGGTLVRSRGSEGLLDLYVSAPELFFAAGEKGEALAETQSLRSLGIEKLKINESLAWQSAFKKLDVWRSSSPVSYPVFTQALRNLPFYYSRLEIAPHDTNYYLPDQSHVESLQTMALYINQFGVFVSKEKYEKLSLENQTALILHEALRHMQISYKMGLTDQGIQRLVAVLMQGPGKVKSLDEFGVAEGIIAERVLWSYKTQLSLKMDLKKINELHSRIAKQNPAFQPTAQSICEMPVHIDYLMNGNLMTLAIEISALADAILKGIDQTPNAFLKSKDGGDLLSLVSLVQSLSLQSSSMLTEASGDIAQEVSDDVLRLGKIVSFPLDALLLKTNQKVRLSKEDQILLKQIRSAFIARGILKDDR